MRNTCRTLFALALGGVLANVALADDGTEPTAGRPAALAVVQASPLSALDARQVRAVQNALRGSGHYRGEVDGHPGPATEAALTAFQKERAIDVAFVDRQTLDALGVKSEWSPEHDVDAASAPEPVAAGGPAPRPAAGVSGAAPPSAEQPPDDAGSRGDAVPSGEVTPPVAAGVELSDLGPERLAALQGRLRDLGHYSGTVDGLDGPRTRQAFRDFFNHQLGLMTSSMRVTREGALALGVDLGPAQAAAATVPAVATASQRDTAPPR